jgi:8-oxo-dGTP pyrophosphatase MutT (NUDIX family)
MDLKSWIAWKGADYIYGALSRIFWPRASAGAIVIHNESLLAVDMGDYLMIPSGGLEYSETFEQAAIREVFEETGCLIEIKKKLSEKTNSVGGTEVIFQAILVNDEKKSSGWGEPVWIPLDELDDKDWRYNRDVKSIVDHKEN